IVPNEPAECSQNRFGGVEAMLDEFVCHIENPRLAVRGRLREPGGRPFRRRTIGELLPFGTRPLKAIVKHLITVAIDGLKRLPIVRRHVLSNPISFAICLAPRRRLRWSSKRPLLKTQWQSQTFVPDCFHRSSRDGGSYEKHCFPIASMHCASTLSMSG